MPFRTGEQQLKEEWFVTVSCAADALGCDRTDIYDMIKKGFLDFILMPSKEIKISTKSLKVISKTRGTGFLKNTRS